jgi:hypothetical protein
VAHALLEDACARICRPRENDADFEPALLICALAERASGLQERLSAFRRSLPHRDDPLLGTAVTAPREPAFQANASRRVGRRA